MTSATGEHFSSLLDINGAKLAYDDTGRGEPIVLVHANISDIRSWESIKWKLADRFRVISYSRRYHWPNEPIEAGASDPWEMHATDLGNLIEKLDIAPAHLLGNSTGASIALLLARGRPDLVRSLLLEEPPAISIFLPRTPPTVWDVLHFLFSQPRSFLPIMIFAATVISPSSTAFQGGNEDEGLRIFARGVLGDSAYQRLEKDRLEQMRTNIKPHGAIFTGVGLPTISEMDVRSITTPSLLITGQNSVWAHRVINRRLAELMPRSAESMIPQASHLCHEDNPSAVCEVIWDFLVNIAPT